MPPHFGRFVAYYRVSTDKQGKSGLGLEAQRTAVDQRLNGGDWKLIAEFTEVESGKRKKRPELDAALRLCKTESARLVVAKLDRLSRNVTFLLTLLDSGVDVLFADMPEVDGAMGRFIITAMASVAELEAGLISERTKAGLVVAKKRGVKLGRTGAELLAPKYRAEALDRARSLEPLVKTFQDQGYSLRRMAEELSHRKVPTPRGGKWHPQSVKLVLKRLGLHSSS